MSDSLVRGIIVRGESQAGVAHLFNDNAGVLLLS